MYYLYPRIPLPLAGNIAKANSNLPLFKLREQSSYSHPSVQFYESGNRVSQDDLQYIQTAVRTCAEDNGYPNDANKSQFSRFDFECSMILHDRMKLHPFEASHLEMWSFITCILLPDVVRWRFDSDKESSIIDRFIGSDRGLRRNTFGRLWWRAYLLHQPHWEKSYLLLEELHEDDLVQITERNSIAASRTLLNVFCRLFIGAVSEFEDTSRRDLMRESIKRVRRLLSFVAFDMLTELEIEVILSDILEKTANSLRLKV